MKILVDYRPALRERTGVGEYVHRLVQAYSAAYPGEVTLFTSSWKDRPDPALGATLRARVVDRRVPVALLNLLWHRAGWPPVEALAGFADVVHAPHPLLIPARRAAQVITIHDLFFLANRDSTRAEIRRDYAALAGSHARRADAVVTSTEHGRRIVNTTLGVPLDRIYVCPPGAPEWTPRAAAASAPGGYLLFVGTLEPRKNIGALLDAFALLLARRRPVPELLLAGRATADAHAWLQRIQRPPLSGHVRHLGYVAEDQRARLYAGARAVVMPSLDEGFGFPALEAMSAGVPVIASNKGSLPEVIGGAGWLVDPGDVEALAAAIDRVATDDTAAERARTAGLARAATFTWDRAAATLHDAYANAIARRAAR
jgi:glycosyltransferase involved in cell wall biosynthesis